MHSFSRLVTHRAFLQPSPPKADVPLSARRTRPRRMFHLRLWGVGLGFSFCLLGGGRRWKTLAGRCPCSCASGTPTPRGKGTDPLLPLLRPLALTRRIRQGPSGPTVRALLPRVGCTPQGGGDSASGVGRRASCRRNMSEFAGVSRSTWTTGARLVKRSGSREDLGAGPTRPPRSKEREPSIGRESL